VVPLLLMPSFNVRIIFARRTSLAGSYRSGQAFRFQFCVSSLAYGLAKR
jgi:hypothetical protein